MNSTLIKLLRLEIPVRAECNEGSTLSTIADVRVGIGPIKEIRVFFRSVLNRRSSSSFS